MQRWSLKIFLIALFSIPTTGMSASLPDEIDQTPGFNWSQPLDNVGRSPGMISENLPVCPKGVRADEPHYHVYISDGKNSETATVVGGTCRGDGFAGTLEFETHNRHLSSAKIGSASEGLQEQVIAARFAPSNPKGYPQAGKVIVPAREIKTFATIAIRSSGMTLDLSGSILECHTPSACVFVGDPDTSTLFSDITIIGARGRPTVAEGTAPFIEVNAQGTRLINVSTRIPLDSGAFGNLVQVDDDQAFLLDGLSTQLGGTGVRCDATVCNPVIYAPGPFNKYSAVGWLKNLNLSIGCRGNGVDWQSGNTLRISDSVIQGYSQYGVRAGTRRGGYGGFAMDNVYQEVGRCTNPLGNIGAAGVIAEGAGVFGVKLEGGTGPAGKVPQFAKSGTIDFRYYIVAHHALLGASNPLYAGNALTNGTGNITVTTPDISGANTFDVLRTTVFPEARNQGPYGSGNYAVAVNVSRTSACKAGVCTFTDTQAPLRTYAVASPSYFPMLDFWPGALVLGANGDSRSISAPARAYLDNAFDSIVSVLGSVAPSVMANRCDAADKWTPIWISCTAADVPSSLHEQGGLLLMVKPNHDGGKQRNLKGRLNFTQLGTGPGHIVTLSDSAFDKTVATANNRPSNDPNDAFIGYDQANGDPAEVGISFGAPKSLSSYIGTPGDGTAWLERLTKQIKAFKVPVSAISFRTDTNCASPVGTCGSAAAGRVAIAAGQNSVTVESSAVTTESEIHVDENFSYGAKLGIKCNRNISRRYVISAQSEGKFTITTNEAPVGDPACLGFSISN